MNKNHLNSRESADTNSTDKAVSEPEIVRKLIVPDPTTIENDSDKSRDPTVQDRPVSEDLIKAAIAQQAMEEKQGRRKLIVSPDPQVESEN